MLLVALLVVAVLGGGGYAAASTVPTASAEIALDASKGPPPSPPESSLAAAATAGALPATNLTQTLDPSTAVPSTDTATDAPAGTDATTDGETVTGTVNATANVTDDAQTETTDVLNGTTNATGDLLDGTTDARNETTNVTGDVRVGEDPVNASVGLVSGGSAGNGSSDETAGTTTEGPSSVEPDESNGSSTGAVVDGPGSAPSRGGGLPRAVGGAAALGLATVAGAALLHRSAALADGAAWSSVQSGIAELRRGDAGPGDWLRWVLWSTGYSRYDESDPLAHETRAALYRRIEDAPGVYLTSLADHLDVPISTARYHLRILTAESLVTTSMIRGKRRYFPVSTEDEALQAALEDETQTNLLSGIARRGGATVTTLARDLDRDASTVTYQLQHLADADLVERERDGRQVWNRLAPHVEPYFEDSGADTD